MVRLGVEIKVQSSSQTKFFLQKILVWTHQRSVPSLEPIAQV